VYRSAGERCTSIVKGNHVVSRVSRRAPSPAARKRAKKATWRAESGSARPRRVGGVTEATEATEATVAADATDASAATPTWRGWLHVGAFVLAVPAGAALIATASGAAARASASVYVISVLCGFGLSAAYHRLARSERARAIMRRVDHSMIFVLIAGTYTPICLMGLPGAWGIPLLATVWALALCGIAVKLLAFDRPGWRTAGYVLYPVIGWAAVVAGPAMVSSFSGTQLALIVGGGLLYTIGFPVLLCRRPDPWPHTFGYHEVWHAFTVAAGVAHFAAVATVVSAA
jgi:hemolysin III